jgi:hypothetical protein
MRKMWVNKDIVGCVKQCIKLQNFVRWGENQLSRCSLQIRGYDIVVSRVHTHFIFL